MPDIRPPHIAPLDAAHEEWIAKFAEANVVIDAFLDEHLVIIDLYQKVIRARTEAKNAVLEIEAAIDSLGYSTLGSVGRGISGLNADEQFKTARDFENEARARREEFGNSAEFGSSM